MCYKYQNPTSPHTRVIAFTNSASYSWGVQSEVVVDVTVVLVFSLQTQSWRWAEKQAACAPPRWRSWKASPAGLSPGSSAASPGKKQRRLMQVRKAVIGLLVVLQVNLKLHTDCSVQKGSMKVKRRIIKKRQIWGWLLQNRYAKSKVPDNTEKASVTFYIVTDLMYFYFCREFTSLSLPRQEEESVQSWVLHWTVAPPPGVQRAFSPPLSSRWSSWNSSIRMLCWLWSVVTSTGSLERMQRWELKSRCVSDAFRGSLNLNCIKYKRHVLDDSLLSTQWLSAPDLCFTDRWRTFCLWTDCCKGAEHRLSSGS